MTNIRTLPPTGLAARTSAPMSANFYQMGFVTADLDAAQERPAARFGIRHFRVKRDPARMSTAHA